MSARKCVICGRDPAEGFASIWHNGREDWYCHGDDDTDVSCYVVAASGYRSSEPDEET
jgi:hypothetical protein